MATRNNNMIPVDGYKLLAQLHMKGLDFKSASLDLGYTSNFLAKSTQRRTLKKSVIISIENQFGIKYDDIKPDIPETPPEVHTETLEEKFGITYDSIKPYITETSITDTIETAVYNGIMKAFSNITVQTQIADFLTKTNAEGWKLAWRERLEQQAEDRRLNRNRS